ncbi:MAG: hypothetical protein FWF08_07390 [Oscillospiraceae bacterium]|nr:hypothetical protein [Oscillospiraceae bacterium]
MNESKARHISLSIISVQMILLALFIRYIWEGVSSLYYKTLSPSVWLFADVFIFLAIGVFLLLSVYYKPMFYVLTAATVSIGLFYLIKYWYHIIVSAIKFGSDYDIIIGMVLLIIVLLCFAPHMFYYVARLRPKKQKS